MKSNTMKSAKLFLIIFTFALCQLLITSTADCQDEYVFEKMWPVIQSNWYFNNPSGLAVDSNNRVYITDLLNHRIQVFTIDGVLISMWGSHGHNNGEFLNPNGVVVDENNNLYITDQGNCRVQKFDSDGNFITNWGYYGENDGEFLWPSGIATDGINFVYIVDQQRHNIQKFDLEGNFITKWGKKGFGDGELDFQGTYMFPGIAVDSNGNVYVSDFNNHRVQKFDADGNYILSFGEEGSGEGQFSMPGGIAVDKDDIIYVLDAWANNRIQKFNTTGVFVEALQSQAFEGDLLDISIDRNGIVFVSDGVSGRITKLKTSGEFVAKWSSDSTRNGEFFRPRCIAANTNGSIYITDGMNGRVQAFDMQGNFISKWGTSVSDLASSPHGITLDADGYLYTTDIFYHSVIKFDQFGNLIGNLMGNLGEVGENDGQFNFPRQITSDASNNLYVVDFWNNRIQKFASNGTFITNWGTFGSNDSQFNNPTDIVMKSQGLVYVTDTGNNRIQIFDQDGNFISKISDISCPGALTFDSQENYMFITNPCENAVKKYSINGSFIELIAEGGSDSGMVSGPEDIYVNEDNRIYVVDTGNNRIQVFKPKDITTPTTKYPKAIVVAGGGPFPGNNLWNATQMVANFAYRTLTYQGYNKDTIYYLSHDTDLDLDGNGILDDVDADATNANLQNAITTWAAAEDTEDLFIYMVDHGGDGTFRMRGDQLLYATELDTWLDTLQQTMTGQVVLVYDACRSGSFLSHLTPPDGATRILATSAASDQESIFCGPGADFLFLHLLVGNVQRQSVLQFICPGGSKRRHDLFPNSADRMQRQRNRQ